MISPLVNETVWAESLRNIPAWIPPSEPLLVIAPHPDDETLAVGGLIASQRKLGIDVIVAAVTDGERAYPDYPGLAPLRIAEQTAALARLGVASEKIVRFGLPDSDVASHEQELVDRLLQLVSRDTHIVAPWRGDFHPDHEACGRAAEIVAHRTGARLTSYFFWTWHRGAPELLDRMRLGSFQLNNDLLSAKNEALLCHTSQLAHHSGDPILPENLLAPARRPFEVLLLP